MISAKYRYLNCGLIISVLVLTFAPNAAAESAKEQLQGTINRVIEVLRTIHSVEDIERNRNSLRQILLIRFDFAAMAEKSLGNHWKDLEGRKEEFVSTFTDFVEHSYMSTLGSYRGEKIVYDRDRSDGESAEVDTRVVGGQGLRSKSDTSSISQVDSGWSTMRLSMTSALWEIIGLSSREFFTRARWRN